MVTFIDERLYLTQRRKILHENTDANNVKRAIAIKTLNAGALGKATRQLAAMLPVDFTPGIVIGIRTGGYIVAKTMLPFLPADSVLFAFTCRRQSTDMKSNFSTLKNLLMKLPYFITDRMRLIEHILLTRKPAGPKPEFIPDAAELSAIETALKRPGLHPGILIVDDAVDSGATLAATVECIRKIAGNTASIKTVAITVTTTSPLTQPDYVIYSHVLCRFHWSLDFSQ